MNDLEIISGWINDLRTIGDDVRSLRLGSRVFWVIQEIIGANRRTQAHGLFNHWMATNYAVATAIGIRRQLDSDRRSVSLARLLSAVAGTLCKRPALLSRAGFIRNYRRELRIVGDAEFDRLVGQSASRVEPSFVCRDLQRLQIETESVRRSANKRAAHWDRRAVPKSKLGELDKSLDLLVELVDKYARLMNGTSSSVEVGPLPPDWKRIFKVSWIA